MKPKRFYFKTTALFSQPLRYGAPVFIGFTVLLSGLQSEAGIYGGTPSASAAAAPSSSAGGGTSASVAASAPTAARDQSRVLLDRTNRAVGAARAMQGAARAAAVSGPNHLSTPALTLPAVPDGLAVGGLQVAPGVTDSSPNWTGADLPTESADKTQVTIIQTKQQALLEWQTFNVGKGTTVNFNQAKGGAEVGKWIAINRVTDPTGNPTQILGKIKAQGQVYILNANGILFGGSSQVNTRGLTASALPINDNLVARGLLNNPDNQFLFSGLAMPAGANGTPAFTPAAPLTANGHYGDVVVQAGATLTSPSSAAKVGGRITLVGANVSNQGSILTPDGQAILAAGLQVGLTAHASTDPSLRGLDAFIGQVGTYAGSATNSGLVEAPRGSILLTGRSVTQNGVLESSTSVTLNGRIDLLAQFNAISTTGSEAARIPFLIRDTGLVTLGEDSLIRILPELASKETSIGSELALPSQFNAVGNVIHLSERSTILAPNASVKLSAGIWYFPPSFTVPVFLQAGGQVYLGKGSLVDVSGSKGVEVPVEQNIVTVQLRGAELAGSPLQRLGALRNQTVSVDIRDAGSFQQAMWVGTPLADVSGFANLIQKGVGQLTVAGGTVSISAGDSVVMQQGSKVDVSSGYIDFTGGRVKTTVLTANRRLVDIKDAVPNELYDGIAGSVAVESNLKWGITETFNLSLTPQFTRFEEGYVSGAAGGKLAVSAAALALDGSMVGKVFGGPLQRLSHPAASSLKINFYQIDLSKTTLPLFSPNAPTVEFRENGVQTAVAPFALDQAGAPLALTAERENRVFLSPDLLATSGSGFGQLTVENHDGNIIIPENVTLAGQVGGAITLVGSNITVDGKITLAGGDLTFRTHSISLERINSFAFDIPGSPPPAEAGRGLFTLGQSGVLNVSGSVADDRPAFIGSLAQPLSLEGGSVLVQGYSATLAAGGLIDVSGGSRVAPGGTVTYGDAGGVTLATGREIDFSSTLGGKLSLGAEMRGFSGAKGGKLALTASAIQVGGSVTQSDITLLQPDFFSQGGFATISLAGIGLATSTTGVYAPGIAIADGTTLRPVVSGHRAILTGPAGLVLEEITREEGFRNPLALSFSALGATFEGIPLVVGNVRMGTGSSITIDGTVTTDSVITSPGKGSVSFSGQTVELFGAVTAPGGAISVAGRFQFPVSTAVIPTDAQTTTHLGATASLSTAGKTVLIDAPFGLRRGQVIAGGSISVTGNIVAERGARLDVSGTRGVLDLAPSYRAPGAVTNSFQTTPITLASNAGAISLAGSEFLFTDATLVGNAGGTSATGGKLNVSSGKFLPINVAYTTADINLVVSQNQPTLTSAPGLLGVGNVVRNAAGAIVPQLGNIAASSFETGGFDSLALNGNVRFSGPVTIAVPGSLRVASGGVIEANAAVQLSAHHVTLGLDFRAPTQQAVEPLFTQGVIGFPDISNYSFSPKYGPGSLTVTAALIDLGDLSLQGIGSATLDATAGDIRGNGTLNLAGGLTLKAGQIYPTTQRAFNVFAYDYSLGGANRPGTVSILAGAARSLPLSGGGTLSIYASKISQAGTLRAPIGTINLGWDGTGTAPLDPISGTPTLANPFVRPITGELTLASGSTTSVSAIDPLTGKAVLIPYGLSLDGKTWIDPAGNDITINGAPSKIIRLSATQVTTEANSTTDIRGGGDLYAYRWISGNGGKTDVLAADNRYAILPNYGFDYAPFAPFNQDSTATKLGGQPGYTAASLSVGDRITLAAGGGLAAGTYTLLPARYALLPGAFLVTPQTGEPVGTVARPGGVFIVSGYRANEMAAARAGVTKVERFEIATSAIVRKRSEYQDLLANSVLKQAAISRELSVPRLPEDSGYLSFSARANLSLAGQVRSLALGSGRGSLIDINNPGSILINPTGTGGAVGELVLRSSLLNSFGAESLLIGGQRSFTSTGITVAVNADNLTVESGTQLTGTDLILVAENALTLGTDSSVTATGQAALLDSIQLGTSSAPGSGDGALVRVSASTTAAVTRAGVTSSTRPSLNVLGSASLTGTSIFLDSTAASDFSPTATITGQKVSLSSGQISLQLNQPGSLSPTTGLVLSSAALANLQASSKALTLLSYSSIDVYGTGTVGSSTFEQLALQAAAIRGFNTGSGTATFTAANLRLENLSGRPAPSAVTTPLSGNLRFDGNQITLGSNALRIDGFSDTTLAARSGILTTGTGSFSAAGTLALQAPFITSTSAANYQISSDGAFQFTRPTFAPTTSLLGGFGAQLTLRGASLNVESDVTLASGVLTLQATAGNVTIGNTAASRLDVGGTATSFVDVTRYTSGGTVNLLSTTGSVQVLDRGVISLSARDGGGNAGKLNVATPAGSFDLSGSILASAGPSGEKGEFSLDTGSLVGGDLTLLDAALNTGFFSESRHYRIRSGNVTVGGNIFAHDYRVSVDQGSLTVTGKVDASGTTGGDIQLQSSGSLILASGSELTVAGQKFDSAGKGGSITLEAGAQRNGAIDRSALLDLRAGSTLDLSVAAFTPDTSASLGQFTGKLHLRAPRNVANTDLQVGTIASTITGASSILVEGYKLYDLTDYGGTISADVQNWTKIDANAFLGEAGTTSANYTAITNRLLANNSGLSSAFVLAPGAEMINSAKVSNTALNLSAVNSTIAVPAGGSILFPTGTPGNNLVRSTVAATIISATGTSTPLAANTSVAIPAGSALVFSGSQGTVSYVSGTGGAIGISLVAGSSYTTGATNSTATISNRGSAVTLNTAGTSSIALSAGSVVTLPTGTVGTNRIRASVAGTITSRNGIVTALAANTSTAIEAGSYINLISAGNLSFASGGTGGAIQVGLASGSFTTAGATSVIPATGDLTLGTLASTATSDWNLESFRFGAESAPGVLTLKATGNLVFFNALSDGFAAVTRSALNGQSSLWLAPLMAQNPLLPVNTQSWSYRFTAGADFSSANFQAVLPSSSLTADRGSLLLGKNYGNATTYGSGTAFLTSTAITNRYQVIRTGSGDITINAARDALLLNQFATIYTVGTQVLDPTQVLSPGDFVTPVLLNGRGRQPTPGSVIGDPQQNYFVQYSMAGGEISIQTGNNIARMTRTVDTGLGGSLIADSSRQLPTNWLYRRGFVDPVTGLFGIGGADEGSGATSITDPSASTTWWVDYSNFFQGIGTLGGGNITLTAGNDVQNIDALAPTNARMAKGKPDASKIIELGGGDISVSAGRNIDGGVFYVERGNGQLQAGASITTNSTRSPSGGINSSLTSPEVFDPNTWLPTTLYLGKGGFDVQAARDVLLGPVVNAFLVPQGYGNKFWYKTYFSTYAPDSYVNTISLGGNLTHRTEVSLPTVTTSVPVISSWLDSQQLLGTLQGAASFQPWLRIAESDVASFRSLTSLLAPNLQSTALTGNIRLQGDLTLSPAPKGQLELIAKGSIGGLQASGLNTNDRVQTYITSTVNLSDADPLSIPSITSPYAYQQVVGRAASALRSTNTDFGFGFLTFLDDKFNETGSSNGSLQNEQSLHTNGLLHLNDSSPVRVYALGGDIDGLSLFTPKSARVLAGQDIGDVALYLQNLKASDTSVVSAGRDITLFNASTVSRVAANAAIASNTTVQLTPLAGDIQISGPGELQVIAGRSIDLGLGGGKADGTGVGITSIGNSRNPYLTFGGANLSVASGLGPAASLLSSSLKFAAFIQDFVLTPAGTSYLEKIAPGVKFSEQTAEEQARLALEVFYLILRDAGRDHNNPDSPDYRTYAKGQAAILSLFGDGPWAGELLTQGRDIRTKNGGDIRILTPGGGVTLANTTLGNPSTPPGIVTESGGKISIFADQSINIGIGRIFTLRGGDAMIWSSRGDIAAGSSSRTVAAAPPTRVLVDSQSASVETDLAGLATGGGIGALATVEGVAPADIDLISVTGNVDAGDAGIRVSGNINISAVTVTNAGNIAAGGSSSGVPSAGVSAPSVATVTTASTAAAAANTSDTATQKNTATAPPEIADSLSLISVEVIGYGGGGADEEEEDKDKNKEAQ